MTNIKCRPRVCGKSQSRPAASHFRFRLFCAWLCAVIVLVSLRSLAVMPKVWHMQTTCWQTEGWDDPTGCPGASTPQESEEWGSRLPVGYTEPTAAPQAAVRSPSTPLSSGAVPPFSTEAKFMQPHTQNCIHYLWTHR